MQQLPPPPAAPAADTNCRQLVMLQALVHLRDTQRLTRKEAPNHGASATGLRT